ncbi:MAG: hypothetical protein H6519_04280 [Microthrixaceae bacterium]|nr:hypothetical protein [Microthrixaceae bacterium]
MPAGTADPVPATPRVDLTLSAASIGLTSAASGAMQVVLLVVFATWAGSSTDLGSACPTWPSWRGFSWPYWWPEAWPLTPWGRKLLGRGFTAIREVGGELIGLARDPVKVVQLFGGALFSKLTTILAFTVSVHAFGVDGLARHPRSRLHDRQHDCPVALTPGGWAQSRRPWWRC